jgi:NIMA (never in mitosis gene a)-related kinase
LQHPNIVSMVESFIEGGKLCIVMDYCAGGDLHDFTQRQRGKPVEEGRVLEIFVQLCLAMKHVHDRKMLHRDLKGQNVFLGAGGRLVKVGDFGVAKVCWDAVLIKLVMFMIRL